MFDVLYRLRKRTGAQITARDLGKVRDYSLHLLSLIYPILQEAKWAPFFSPRREKTFMKRNFYV
jgi:hypothetical protein